jgi:hypothetical protein
MYRYAFDIQAFSICIITSVTKPLCKFKQQSRHWSVLTYLLRINFILPVFFQLAEL